MLSKKIVIPLLLSIGVISYIFYQNSNVCEVTEVELVGEEQVNMDGSSSTIQRELPELGNEGNPKVKKIKREDMPDDIKAIDVELELIREGIAREFIEIDKNSSALSARELAIENDIKAADKLVQNMNKEANIDGEAIQAEIQEMLDAPLDEADMPEELSNILNKTDETLLEVEETLDKLKEDM